MMMMMMVILVLLAVNTHTVSNIGLSALPTLTLTPDITANRASAVLAYNDLASTSGCHTFTQ